MNAHNPEGIRNLTKRAISGAVKLANEHPKIATGLLAAVGLAVPLTVLKASGYGPEDYVAMPQRQWNALIAETPTPIPSQDREVFKAWPSYEELVDMASKLLTERGLNMNSKSFVEDIAPQYHIERAQPIKSGPFATRAGRFELVARRYPIHYDRYTRRNVLVRQNELIALMGYTTATSNKLAGGDGLITLYGLDTQPLVNTITKATPAPIAPNVFYSTTGSVYQINFNYYRIAEKPENEDWVWYINPHPTVEPSGLIDWNKPVYEPPQDTSKPLGK